MEKTKTRRTKAAVIDSKTELFRWIYLNRNREIPFGEFEAKVVECLKARVMSYTLRSLGYISFADNTSAVTVAKHFEVDKKLFRAVTRFVRKKHASPSFKRNGNLDNKKVNEIHSMLVKITTYLKIK